MGLVLNAQLNVNMHFCLERLTMAVIQMPLHDTRPVFHVRCCSAKTTLAYIQLACFFGDCAHGEAKARPRVPQLSRRATDVNAAGRRWPRSFLSYGSLASNSLKGEAAEVRHASRTFPFAVNPSLERRAPMLAPPKMPHTLVEMLMGSAPRSTAPGLSP